MMRCGLTDFLFLIPHEINKIEFIVTYEVRRFAKSPCKRNEALTVRCEISETIIRLTYRQSKNYYHVDQRESCKGINEINLQLEVLYYQTKLHSRVCLKFQLGTHSDG
jgi:hypothetical protein